MTTRTDHLIKIIIREAIYDIFRGLVAHHSFTNYLNKYSKQKIIIYIEIRSYPLLHNDRVHMGPKAIEWGFYFPLDCYVSLSELVESWLIQFRSYILNFKIMLSFDFFVKKVQISIIFFGFSTHFIWKWVIIRTFQFQILFVNT